MKSSCHWFETIQVVGRCGEQSMVTLKDEKSRMQMEAED